MLRQAWRSRVGLGEVRQGELWRGLIRKGGDSGQIDIVSGDTGRSLRTGSATVKRNLSTFILHFGEGESPKGLCRTSNQSQERLARMLVKILFAQPAPPPPPPPPPDKDDGPYHDPWGKKGK